MTRVTTFKYAFINGLQQWKSNILYVFGSSLVSFLTTSLEHNWHNNPINLAYNTFGDNLIYPNTLNTLTNPFSITTQHILRLILTTYSSICYASDLYPKTTIGWIDCVLQISPKLFAKTQDPPKLGVTTLLHLTKILSLKFSNLIELQYIYWQLIVYAKCIPRVGKFKFQWSPHKFLNVILTLLWQMSTLHKRIWIVFPS